jgi:hypothetical protein
MKPPNDDITTKDHPIYQAQFATTLTATLPAPVEEVTLPLKFTTTQDTITHCAHSKK